MPDERRGRRLAICTGHADDPELLLWIAVEIGEDKGRCLPHIRTAKLQYIPLRELRDQRAAGTCGLCGQLGVWTGWVNPSDAALANGAAAMAPTAFDWVGLILISFVLPAVLTWAFGLFFRKIGWIKPGDLTLPQ